MPCQLRHPQQRPKNQSKTPYHDFKKLQNVAQYPVRTFVVPFSANYRSKIREQKIQKKTEKIQRWWASWCKTDIQQPLQSTACCEIPHLMDRQLLVVIRAVRGVPGAVVWASRSRRWKKRKDGAVQAVQALCSTTRIHKTLTALHPRLVRDVQRLRGSRRSAVRVLRRLGLCQPKKTDNS